MAAITVNELVKMLQEQVENGHGDDPVHAAFMGPGHIALDVIVETAVASPASEPDKRRQGDQQVLIGSVDDISEWFRQWIG